MSGSLRALVRERLDGRCSRRAFVGRLLGAGVAAASARAFAASLEVPEAGETIEASGGELMARTLRAAGVEYVFGIPGTNEVGFVDALVDHPEIQYVLGLHEGPIAAMADGYAKLAARPAFVNVHSIAGTANVLGQLVNSSQDGTPVVFTAGNQDSRLRGRGSFLESPHLESLPQTYTKWSFDVLRADTIPEVLRRAFKVAATPPGGPVFLTFSKDLWKEPKVRAELLPQERFRPPALLAPGSALVDRAARLLLGAGAPLLVAGDELTKYGGRDLFVELAELLAAPVVGELASGHGRIDFPTQHPQYLGLFPGQRQLGLGFDLVLSGGARMFSEFDYDPQPIVARDVPVIHMSLDAGALGRAYPADVPLLADPEEGLRALLERVKSGMTASRKRENEARLARIAGRRAALVAARRLALAQEWESDPVSPARLAAELNQALDPDAIVVTEAVTSDASIADHIDFHNGRPGRLHLPSHGGNLGWGIGAACGAKLAAPQREVVLLSGDGSFQFGIQGLWTAARYEVPELFVVFNNVNYQSNRLGLVRHGGRAVATGKYIGTYLGDPEVDHVRVAQGYGVDGESVAGPAGLRAAIKRAQGAVRSGRPYVLDVRIARRFPGADVPWHEKFSVARLARRPPQSRAAEPFIGRGAAGFIPARRVGRRRGRSVARRIPE